MSTVEILPDSDQHVVYVWVVDYEGSHAAVTATDGRDPEDVARAHDPRRSSHADSTKVRAALVRVVVPHSEMRRLGQ